MPSRYEIEEAEPDLSVCECCGGLTVRLTRFVCRDGDAFAIYYARYSNAHPEQPLSFLASFGEWGEDSEPTQRTSLFCRVRAANGAYEAMLGDAQDSPWGEVELIGRKLSREQAWGHELRTTVFELLDEAFVADRALRGFLSRARCGEPSAPLEWTFEAPDELLALGAEREARAVLGRSFASLDGRRFFIRCLLPVPVEGYGAWKIGVWIEVSRADHEHATRVWDDPERYRSLHFAGVVANDARGQLELPIAKGSVVELQVRDPDGPPEIHAAVGTELGALLMRRWPRRAFETYAVARGFL